MMKKEFKIGDLIYITHGTNNQYNTLIPGIYLITNVSPFFKASIYDVVLTFSNSPWSVYNSKSLALPDSFIKYKKVNKNNGN